MNINKFRNEYPLRYSLTRRMDGVGKSGRLRSAVSVHLEKNRCFRPGTWNSGSVLTTFLNSKNNEDGYINSYCFLSVYQVSFTVFEMLQILSLIFTTVLKGRGHFVPFAEERIVAQ